MTSTTSTATGIEIARFAYIDSDVEGLSCRLDGDQVTAILSVGAEFFAIGEEWADDEIEGYSWAWGERTDDGPDYFGQDGGATETEAREAVTKWLATVAR